MKPPDVCQSIARPWARALLRLLHAAQWTGRENVPRRGPVILACNHQSFYDPVLVSAGSGRSVCWLAWVRYYRMPILNQLMRMFGVEPVDLARPAGSLARMLRRLRRGEACGIFPEGGRTLDGRLMPAKSGVAALALRSGSPVVPVTVGGGFRAWPKHHALPASLNGVAVRLRVHYGRPLWPPRTGRADPVVREAFAQRIMDQIAAGLGCLEGPAAPAPCVRA